MFETETWIVTGASRGIGAALADTLWAQGARLVLNARSRDQLAAKAAELGDASRIRTVAGDIGEEDTAEAIAAAASELGGPLGLVHNAGVAAPGPMVWELEPAEARVVLGSSLDGSLHLVRTLVPLMRKAGNGSLVFVGSGIAERNMVGLGAYGIAKAAEEHLARQVALEAPELVSFVWRPGVVDTDMQAEARASSQEVAAPFRDFKASGRLISPAAAAAHLVTMLAGDRTALSGTTISAM